MDKLFARSPPGVLAMSLRLIRLCVVEDAGFTSSGVADTSTFSCTAATANWKCNSLPVPEFTGIVCDCGENPSAEESTSYTPAGTAVNRNAPLLFVSVSCFQSEVVE